MDSDLSASSPVVRRRAEVLKARRAMIEAIGTVLMSKTRGGEVELLRSELGRVGRVASLDVWSSYDGFRQRPSFKAWHRGTQSYVSPSFLESATSEASWWQLPSLLFPSVSRPGSSGLLRHGSAWTQEHANLGFGFLVILQVDRHLKVSVADLSEIPSQLVDRQVNRHPLSLAL